MKRRFFAAQISASTGLFLCLVLVLLPLRLWRAGQVESLWIDEIHSLVLASHSVSDVVRSTAEDAHPPAYFLALKAWIRLGRWLGLEPALLWARALNVVTWLAASLACWVAARRSFGKRSGSLIACAIASAAATATLSHDIRNYCFAWAGITLAYLSLVSVRLESGRGPQLSLWLAFGLSASLAIWSHLLASIVLACLVLSWLGRALWTPEGRRASLRCLGACTGVIAVFLPWLWLVPKQIEGLAEAAPSWMTPATIANLLAAQTYWLPVGRVGIPTLYPFTILWALAIVSLALPMMIALGSRFARSSHQGGESRARQLSAAWVGFSTAALAVFVLWILARWGIAPVFHGPRYPLLAAGPLSGAIGASATLLHRMTSRSRLAAWLAVFPWTALGIIASIWGGLLEGKGGLQSALRAAGIGSAYVMPSEIIDLSGMPASAITTKPIERLPCDQLDESSAAGVTIIDLNPWRRIDRARDTVAREALTKGLLGTFLDESDLIAGRSGARLYRLLNPNLDAAQLLCERGLAQAGSPVPTHRPGSTALAVDQIPRDGWSYLELGRDLVPRRWANTSSALIRFDSPLPKGDALLRIWGSRLPQPAESQVIEIEIPGASPGTVRRPLGSGRFLIEIPLRIEEEIEDPVVIVHHPTWSPRAAYGSNDERTLAFALEGAWAGN